MSIEQAKAIKAKREFAQELEDVKDFEKKVVGGSEGRSSRKKLGSGRKDVRSSDEDEDDEEQDDKPRKKRIVCDPRPPRPIRQLLTETLLHCRALGIVSTLSLAIKVMMIRFYTATIH